VVILHVLHQALECCPDGVTKDDLFLILTFVVLTDTVSPKIGTTNCVFHNCRRKLFGSPIQEPPKAREHLVDGLVVAIPVAIQPEIFNLFDGCLCLGQLRSESYTDLFTRSFGASRQNHNGADTLPRVRQGLSHGLEAAEVVTGFDQRNERSLHVLIVSLDRWTFTWRYKFT
jgi:hypothetical protein